MYVACFKENFYICANVVITGQISRLDLCEGKNEVAGQQLKSRLLAVCIRRRRIRVMTVIGGASRVWNPSAFRLFC